MPCGGESWASTAAAISVRTDIASSLCKDRLNTFTTEPSSVCTTDSVAVSRSMNNSRSSGVTNGAAHGLRQRPSGMAVGHQHHVVDATGRQGVAQRGGLGVVTPRDADRLQVVASSGSAFLGAKARPRRPVRPRSKTLLSLR